MEPASSTLATLALAASTILPTCHPLFEVRLRNWENKTHNKIECCWFKKVSPIQTLLEKQPVAEFDPGTQNVDTLIYSRQNMLFSGSNGLRVISVNEDNYFNFLLIYYTNMHVFQVSCVHNQIREKVNRLGTLLDEHIRWDQFNPPKYVLIEIDGTIVQDDLLNTTFKVEHEMFKLEKLK